MSHRDDGLGTPRTLPTDETFHQLSEYLLASPAGEPSAAYRAVVRVRTLSAAIFAHSATFILTSPTVPWYAVASVLLALWAACPLPRYTFGRDFEMALTRVMFVLVDQTPDLPRSLAKVRLAWSHALSLRLEPTVLDKALEVLEYSVPKSMREPLIGDLKEDIAGWRLDGSSEWRIWGRMLRQLLVAIMVGIPSWLVKLLVP